MGVPKISYDFQAPIGEFGRVRDSYQYLRILHLFLQDFGHLLAPMQTVLPEGYKEITPGNRETLRYAVRVKDNSGFVFMTNFQDHDTARVDQTDLQLVLRLKDETLKIPTDGKFTLKKDVSAILPFNLDMDGILLKYATAQLLTRIDDNGKEHYIFCAPDGLEPEYRFDKTTLKAGKEYYKPIPGVKSTFTVTSKQGKKVMITTMTREQALNLVKLDNRVLITKATVLPEEGRCTLLSLGENKIDYIVYPSKYGWKQQTIEVEKVQPIMEWKKVGNRRMVVHVEQPDYPQVHEYFLNIHYTGDVAMAFMNGYLELDHFYYGAPWTIGLKRFRSQLDKHDMNFYIRPLRKNAPYLNDLPAHAIPDFSKKGENCIFRKVEVIPEYKAILSY